jgi:hypothetical protein
MEKLPGVSEQITDTNRRRTHPNQEIFSSPLPTATHGATTLRGVRQDNPAPPRDRIASPQAGSVKKDMRSHQTSTNLPRSKKRPTPKRRTAQLILWVNPLVKAEIQRIAEAEGLSISATGAAFLEHAVKADIHTQHGALLETIINKAIGKHMRAYSNRLAVLLVRSLFTSEETRSFTVNILGRQKGITDTELAQIKNGASNTARANIIRITPQLKTLIEAVEKWLEEAEKEVDASG